MIEAAQASHDPPSSECVDRNSSRNLSGRLIGGSIIKKVPSVYSPQQIQQYLDKVGYRDAGGKGGAGDHQISLGNLTLLMRCHLLTFPFENTAVHYTPRHEVDLEPGALFDRLVNQRFGSYCYGQNSVFLGIIRGLGYPAYTGHGRAYLTRVAGDPPSYGFLSHLVIFVQPSEGSNETYLVDVGYGSPGMVRPILLAEGAVVKGAMAPEMHRLTRLAHPLSSIEPSEFQPGANEAQFHRLWRLEMFHDGVNTEARQVLFLVSEQESYPIDWENGSFISSHKPGSTFYQTVLCVRYLKLADDIFASEDEKASHALPPDDPSPGDDSIVRYIMFFNDVKRIAGRESRVVRELTTELERIRALRELFGLNVPDEAEELIQGRAPAFSLAKET